MGYDALYLLFSIFTSMDKFLYYSIHWSNYFLLYRQEDIQVKILHITPHCGGGVKTVLLGWVCNDKKHNHIIMSLGYVEEQTEKICNENKIPVFSNAEHSLICKYISEVDIIVVHYWNFPLLLKFFLENKLPSCRLITWFHNSGFHSPYNLPEEIIKLSDKVVFTSDISYKLDIFKDGFYNHKLEFILSTGGIEKYLNVKKHTQPTFNILYAGTLDFAKMYKGYIKICNEISKQIPKARFIICGTGSSEKELIQETELYGIRDKFVFTGLVRNLIPYFEVSDVFMYLLSPTHFGTAEQILAEAMAAEIVPIVFDNECEKSIVTHGSNGYVVLDEEECLLAINDVYNSKKDGDGINIKLGQSASNTIKEKYSVQLMIDKWNTLFEQVILTDKVCRQWNTVNKGIYEIGVNCFIEALDEKNSKIFHTYIYSEKEIKKLFNSNLQWKSKSKGSIDQYLEYFPTDKYLNKFKGLMEE
jgi:L-malate glycosyltransferase